MGARVMGVQFSSDLTGLHIFDPVNQDKINELFREHGMSEVHLKIVFGDGTILEFSQQATPENCESNGPIPE